MDEYNFENLYISKNEVRLAKRLKRMKNVKYSEKYNTLIYNGFAKYINFTQNEIGESVPIQDYIHVTERGIAYLQYLKEKRRSNLRSNIAILISLFALIIAALSLVLQYVQYKSN